MKNKFFKISIFVFGIAVGALSIFLYVNRENISNGNYLNFISGQKDKSFTQTAEKTNDESVSLAEYVPKISQESASDLLKSFQESYRIIAKRVLPSIVNIDTTTKEKATPNVFGNLFGFPFENPEKDDNGYYYKREGIGSGIIIRQTGGTVYVLSNYHVLGGADSIKITTNSGQTFDATYVGGDEKRDIAVASFKSTMPVQILKFTKDTVYPGDIVFAIGSPFGFRSTITQGIISAVGRDLEATDNAGFNSYIQTDAAINKGNSGGALVNISGELIGMNTLIYSSTGSNAGIAFSIPSYTIESVIDEIITNGKVKYGWLGITMLDLTEDNSSILGFGKKTEGVFVVNVIKKSPAMQYGINPGDLVLEIDGAKLKSTQELTRKIAVLIAGETHKFKILRNEQVINLEVKISERNDEVENQDLFPGFLAISIEDEMVKQIKTAYNIDVKQGTVIIGRVLKGSSAELSGLANDDVIEEINGKKITNLRDFYSSLSTNEKEYRLKVRKLNLNRELTIIIEK